MEISIFGVQPQDDVWSAWHTSLHVQRTHNSPLTDTHTREKPHTSTSLTLRLNGRHLTATTTPDDSPAGRGSAAAGALMAPLVWATRGHKRPLRTMTCDVDHVKPQTGLNSEKGLFQTLRSPETQKNSRGKVSLPSSRTSHEYRSGGCTEPRSLHPLLQPPCPCHMLTVGVRACSHAHIDARTFSSKLNFAAFSFGIGLL
jgi:hypothetical protein